MRTYERGTLVCDEGVLTGQGMTVYPDGSVSLSDATFVTSWPGLRIHGFWTHTSTVQAWSGEGRISGEGPHHWPCSGECD